MTAKKGKRKTITGVVTASPDYYIPKDVPCRIVLNEKGYVHSAHRVSDGAGTFLYSAYLQKNTHYIEITE